MQVICGFYLPLDRASRQRRDRRSPMVLGRGVGSGQWEDVPIGVRAH